MCAKRSDAQWAHLRPTAPLTPYSYRFHAACFLGCEGHGSLTIEEFPAGEPSSVTSAAPRPTRGHSVSVHGYAGSVVIRARKGSTPPLTPDARRAASAARPRAFVVVSESDRGAVGLFSVCGPGWQGAPFGSGRSAVRIRPHGPLFPGRVFERPSRFARAEPATRSLPNGRACGAPLPALRAAGWDEARARALARVRIRESRSRLRLFATWCVW